MLLHRSASLDLSPDDFYLLRKRDGGKQTHGVWLQSVRVAASLFAGASDTSCKTQLLNQILSTSKRCEASNHRFGFSSLALKSGYTPTAWRHADSQTISNFNMELRKARMS